MSRLRFKVGDLAVYVGPQKRGGVHHIGKVMEVAAVGPFAPTETTGVVYLGQMTCNGLDVPMDYVVRYDEFRVALVNDPQLRPLRDPDSDDALAEDARIEERA